MGICFSSEGVSLAANREADAPLEVMWETLRDVPQSPAFLSQLDTVELLGKKGKPIAAEDFVYQEGATWKEALTFENRVYETVQSITSIEETVEDGAILSRTVRTNSQFLRNGHTQSAHTATYTLQRSGPSKCHLRATSAFVPSGCLGKLDFWWRGKRAHELFMNLMDEFALEAEKRYKERKHSAERQ